MACCPHSPARAVEISGFGGGEKVRQPTGTKLRVGPAGFLESRTAIAGPAKAISTQASLLPLPLLWLLFRHLAPYRSTVDTRIASPLQVYSSLATRWMSATDSARPSASDRRRSNLGSDPYFVMVSTPSRPSRWQRRTLAEQGKVAS